MACSETTPSLLRPAVEFICLAVLSVSAQSDLPAVDMRVGAFETALENRNECISALEWPIDSEDGEIVSEGSKVDSLDGCLLIAEGRASPILETILDQVPQFCTAEATCSTAEVSSRSAESLLQVFWAYKS